MNETTALALRESPKRMLQIEAYRAAALRANAIARDLRLESDDDVAQATVDRKAIKDGIAAIAAHVKSRAWLPDDDTRAVFSALEAAESSVKDEAKRLSGMLAARIELIDEAIKDRTRRENARIAAEYERARLEAAAAARAAAAAAAAEDPFEEAPPPAEVYVEPQKAVTHVKVGAAKSTVKTTPVKCELWLDPDLPPEQALAAAVQELAAKWPHALTLNSAVAKAEFAALQARGQVERPSEAGTIVHGVRFYVDLVVSG